MFCPTKFNRDKLTMKENEKVIRSTWECEREECAWWRMYGKQGFNETTQTYEEGNGACAVLDIAYGTSD